MTVSNGGSVTLGMFYRNNAIQGLPILTAQKNASTDLQNQLPKCEDSLFFSASHNCKLINVFGLLVGQNTSLKALNF